MNNLKLQYEVKEGMLLRDFLLNKNISKKTLTRIKFDNDGSIKVNSKEENVRYKLSLGDVVEITLPSENFSDNVRFLYGKLNILYEDEYFLVLDKEKNLPTIPSRNNDDNSLLEYVNFYFKEKNYTTIPHVVTRLDKNTTGLVLVAKHRHIHALFSKTEISKYYLALTHGKTPRHKIIEANISRTEDSIITRKVCTEGEYAKTELFREKYFEDMDVSLIKLKLFTGRTHQIRVHSQHIGHSLLGDELYGGNKKFIDRQALHCHNLIFEHPITSEKINIESLLPDDMQSFINNFK